MNSKRLLGGNRKKEQNIKEGITVWRDTEKIIIYTENDKNIYDETKRQFQNWCSHLRYLLSIQREAALITQVGDMDTHQFAITENPWLCLTPL